MPRSPHSPNSDERLRRCLVDVIETTQALHVMVVSLTIDLTALRRTVLEDEVLESQYDEHLRTATSAARPLVAEVKESYRELLARVEELDTPKN